MGSALFTVPAVMPPCAQSCRAARRAPKIITTEISDRRVIPCPRGLPATDEEEPQDEEEEGDRDPGLRCRIAQRILDRGDDVAEAGPHAARAAASSDEPAVLSKTLRHQSCRLIVAPQNLPASAPDGPRGRRR